MLTLAFPVTFNDNGDNSETLPPKNKTKIKQKTFHACNSKGIKDILTSI